MHPLSKAISIPLLSVPLSLILPVIVTSSVNARGGHGGMIVSGDLAAAITASEWAEFFRAGASDLFLWLVLLGYVVIGYLVWHRTVRHSSVASETSSVQRRWRLLRGRNWLAFVQIPGLIGLAILGWLGLTTRDPGVGNMVTGLLWVIWWPALVFLLLLLGRGWCLVCPFGAISDLIQRFRQPVRQWPQRLRNPWIQTGLFVFLTWGLGYFDIFSSHVATSWLLVAMAAASGLIGVFFVGRAFCRYLCPIGGMIGLYSLAAPYRLEVGCSKVPCTFSRECGRACARQELDLQLSHYDVGASLLQHPRRLDGAVQAFGLVGVTLMQTLIMTSAWQELLPKLAPDGSNQRRLTNTPFNELEASWIPTGEGLLVIADQYGKSDLFLMSKDGFTSKLLVDLPGDNWAPIWSPDGVKLAFVNGLGPATEMYLVNRDGTGLQKLTNNSGWDYPRAWSPGGKLIAFSSDRDGNREIYTMDPEGGRVRRLTHHPAWDGHPYWSPGGARIMFESDRGKNGAFEIMTMFADGRRQW